MKLLILISFLAIVNAGAYGGGHKVTSSTTAGASSNGVGALGITNSDERKANSQHLDAQPGGHRENEEKFSVVEGTLTGAYPSGASSSMIKISSVEETKRGVIGGEQAVNSFINARGAGKADNDGATGTGSWSKNYGSITGATAIEKTHASMHEGCANVAIITAGATSKGHGSVPNVNSKAGIAETVSVDGAYVGHKSGSHGGSGIKSELTALGGVRDGGNSYGRLKAAGSAGGVHDGSMGHSVVEAGEFVKALAGDYGQGGDASGDITGDEIVDINHRNKLIGCSTAATGHQTNRHDNSVGKDLKRVVLAGGHLEDHIASVTHVEGHADSDSTAVKYSAGHKSHTDDGFSKASTVAGANFKGVMAEVRKYGDVKKDGVTTKAIETNSNIGLSYDLNQANNVASESAAEYKAASQGGITAGISSEGSALNEIGHAGRPNSDVADGSLLKIANANGHGEGNSGGTGDNTHGGVNKNQALSSNHGYRHLSISSGEAAANMQPVASSYTSGSASI